jgi:hypothetical protein
MRTVERLDMAEPGMMALEPGRAVRGTIDRLSLMVDAPVVLMSRNLDGRIGRSAREGRRGPRTGWSVAALCLALLLVPTIAYGSERLDALEGTWRVHNRFDTERLTVGASSPVAGQPDMLGSAPVRNDAGMIGVAVDFASPAADGSYVVLLWPRFGFCEVFAVQRIGRRSLTGYLVYFDAACESVLFDRRFRFTAKRVS